MLRGYQQDIKSRIIDAWRRGQRNVMGVMPTGAGKTVVISSIAGDYAVPNVMIAHREELVGQISLALARCGLYHRLICSDATISNVTEIHTDELKRSFYHPKSPIAVTGIDTMIRRPDDQFWKLAEFWQIDEGHHVAVGNKWARGVGMMPNAWGLAWTATPGRTDRKPLGRVHGGLFDELIIGPSPRWLIENGYLCDYEIYGPKQSIDLARVRVSEATGDFNQHDLHDAAHRSTITGDIVSHYLRIAPGKRGICFAVDVSLAEEHAAAFRAAGVPAAVLSDKTKPKERVRIMRELRAGTILMLVNVDIVGEGVDVPAVEVVIFARPTASLILYIQQFGRVLRLFAGKSVGIVIDHVGNVDRHGLPDRARVWTFEPAPKTRPRDEIPLRTCENLACLRVFESFSLTCPYCGWKPAPVVAGRPDMVEGDLSRYEPALLAAMRAEAYRVVGEFHAPRNMAPGVAKRAREVWDVRANAQHELREAVAWWAGVWRARGASDDESYIRFYRTFGIDVLGAQALGAIDASTLTGKVKDETAKYFNVA